MHSRSRRCLPCRCQQTFHRHFRELTSMSPLQFQKRLRLTEARRGGYSRTRPPGRELRSPSGGLREQHPVQPRVKSAVRRSTVARRQGATSGYGPGEVKRNGWKHHNKGCLPGNRTQPSLGALNSACMCSTNTRTRLGSWPGPVTMFTSCPKPPLHSGSRRTRRPACSSGST